MIANLSFPSACSCSQASGHVSSAETFTRAVAPASAASVGESFEGHDRLFDLPAFEINSASILLMSILGVYSWRLRLDSRTQARSM